MGCRIIFIILEMDQNISVMGSGRSTSLYDGKSPQFLRPQDPDKTKEGRTKTKNKAGKVRKRMYIETGIVLSLSHMFYVRKVLNDIWMVYSGISRGLDLAI